MTLWLGGEGMVDGEEPGHGNIGVKPSFINLFIRL